MKTKKEIRNIAVMQIDHLMIAILTAHSFRNTKFAHLLENNLDGYIKAMKECEIITLNEWLFISRCATVAFGVTNQLLEKGL